MARHHSTVDANPASGFGRPDSLSSISADATAVNNWGTLGSPGAGQFVVDGRAYDLPDELAAEQLRNRSNEEQGKAVDAVFDGLDAAAAVPDVIEGISSFEWRGWGQVAADVFGKPDGSGAPSGLDVTPTGLELDPGAIAEGLGSAAEAIDVVGAVLEGIGALLNGLSSN